MTTTSVNGGKTQRPGVQWYRPTGDGGGPRRRPAGLPRRRRPAPIVAGALVLLAAGAVGGDLALRADHSIAVLTLARPVVAGHQLRAADLAVARLSGSGVHALAASSRGEVLGRRVAATLPADTLLTAGMLTGAAVPGPGQEILGLALKAGAFPPGLAPGAQVAVLQVPAADGRGLSQLLVGSAEVVKVVPDASSGTTVVSVVVGQEQGLAVASAAGAGAVVLAALPAGS